MLSDSKALIGTHRRRLKQKMAPATKPTTTPKKLAIVLEAEPAILLDTFPYKSFYCMGATLRRNN